MLYGLRLAMQESPMKEEMALPKYKVKVPCHDTWPEPAGTEEAADMLMAAENPLLLTEYAAPMPMRLELSRIQSTESVGASVFDINKQLGFPNRHPLSVSFHGDAFEECRHRHGLGCGRLDPQLAQVKYRRRAKSTWSPRRTPNGSMSVSPVWDGASGRQVTTTSRLGSARARRQRVVAADADCGLQEARSTATNRSPAKLSNAKRPLATGIRANGGIGRIRSKKSGMSGP